MANVGGFRNGSEKRPIGFPIAPPTVLGDDLLRLSPSTVGSSDWFQEWLGTTQSPKNLLKLFLRNNLAR